MMSLDGSNKGVVWWQWLIFALLQGFNLYQLVTHAMWRDELQTWSIALESSSILELFFNMRYEEGFPPLWYLSLWGLSFISASPLTMQLFHFICSLAAQTLVMTRAPFSGNLKLAIVTGYFISFEYCIISRAYVLGVLLIFIFCAFQKWLAERPVMKGGVLGLLANTSFYGTIISLAFAADELLSAYRYRSKNEGVNRSGAGMTRFIAAYAVLLVMAVAVMLPREDSNYAPGWDFTPGFEKLLHTCCRLLISLVPVPMPKITFWNSLAMLDAGPWIAIPTALVAMVAVWLILRGSPRYLGIFAMGFIGTWIFSAVRYNGYVRHTGSMMLLLIACVWCAAERNPGKRPKGSRSRSIALWCILSANLLAWAIASYYHLYYDFSGSREMAQIIQQSGKITYPIVADMDFAASSVAGYLRRPLYYVTNQKAQTFIRWNNERTDSGPMKALLIAQDIAAESRSGVLLLLNYPIGEFGNIKLLARTVDSIVDDEVFYLYEYE